MSEPTRQEIMRAVQYAKRHVEIVAIDEDGAGYVHKIEASDEVMFDFVYTVLEDLGIIK